MAGNDHNKAKKQVMIYVRQVEKSLDRPRRTLEVARKRLRTPPKKRKKTPCQVLEKPKARLFMGADEIRGLPKSSHVAKQIGSFTL